MADLRTENYGVPKPDPENKIADDSVRLQVSFDMLDAIIFALANIVAGKANSEHTQAISTITGLAEALAEKMAANATFSLDDLQDVQGAAAAAVNYVLVKNAEGKWVPSTALAALGLHNHAIDEVVGLDDVLVDIDEALDTLAPKSVTYTKTEVDSLLDAKGVPIGTMVHSALDLTSQGYLLADGSPCTTVYPTLRTALLAAGAPFGMSGADPKLPDEVTVSRFRRAANGSIPLGTVQDDQMQQITASLTATSGAVQARQTIVGSGAFTVAPLGQALTAAGGANFGTHDISFNSANSPGARTGDETRPKSIAYRPYIKAFGAITIEGMADLAELLAAIATEAEAILGTNNTKLMTPLRGWQQGAARDGRFVHVRDQKATNTVGGSSAAGVNVRVLNTVVANNIAGASLASNQLTLPAGTYEVFAHAPCFAVTGTQLSIRTSTGTYLLDGPINYTNSASSPVSLMSQVSGKIVLSGTTAIELAHYCETARATNGLGLTSASGRPSIFAELFIKKVD